MEELKRARIVIFYDQFDIKPFAYNNTIYKYFLNELGESQPNVVNPEKGNPFVPICIWDSTDICFSYTLNRIEITFKLIRNNDDLLDKKNRVIKFVHESPFKVNRIGIISVFDVDDDFDRKFYSKYPTELLKSPEFDLSWLKKIEEKDLAYNIWHHYQLVKKSKNLILDVNSSNLNKEINFNSVFEEIFLITKKEVESFNE